mmetsp:Transcript_62509/g.203963  ORF Transcript_62509/g.203963 Transcript_62509/m.203963 type:complete len:370 (-) Transcript_62509:1126-2235(-)
MPILRAQEEALENVALSRRPPCPRPRTARHLQLSSQPAPMIPGHARCFHGIHCRQQSQGPVPIPHIMEGPQLLSDPHLHLAVGLRRVGLAVHQPIHIHAGAPHDDGQLAARVHVVDEPKRLLRPGADGAGLVKGQPVDEVRGAARLLPGRGLVRADVQASVNLDGVGADQLGAAHLARSQRQSDVGLAHRRRPGDDDDEALRRQRHRCHCRPRGRRRRRHCPLHPQRRRRLRAATATSAATAPPATVEAARLTEADGVVHGAATGVTEEGAQGGRECRRGRLHGHRRGPRRECPQASFLELVVVVNGIAELGGTRRVAAVHGAHLPLDEPLPAIRTSVACRGTWVCANRCHRCCGAPTRECCNRSKGLC